MNQGLFHHTQVVRWLIPKTVAAILAAISLCVLASAQEPARVTNIVNVPGVEAVRQNAEAGDATAQVELGNILLRYQYPREALDWYRKAAAQTNTDGAFYAGHLLIYGAAGLTAEHAVKADPASGLHWTFQAATNLHTGAMRDMSKAFLEGRGTTNNFIIGYAWLELLSETVPGDARTRFDLNQLTYKMDSDGVRRGQLLAAEFKQKRWPGSATEVILPPAANEHVFRIDGSNASPTLLINGRPTPPGGSVRVRLSNGGSADIENKGEVTNSTGTGK